ncbi:MAG: hypothetical protein A3C53_02480 [Omnitrophica WOR_2 bacterium RIFCSPHIGHO2_02_FULL_68_15]|nr:MAG: hypothetical protein A3C53_02480 [Omnitrophica WOR_2 bacterium RIFCSPHIGHO2_02_FULL_68_15]
MGSRPATMVFTSRELAMVRAAFWASWAETAPRTSTVIRWPAPSPSRTIAFASVSQTCVSARVNVASAVSPCWIGRFPAAPLASRSTASFVDISPSTVMALNEWATACLRAIRRAGRVIAASVVRNANIVAIAGLIIPDPLAMPPIRTGVPATENSTAVSFTTRSVVMIASAAAREPRGLSPAASAGRAATIRRVGIGRPMTPVEATSTRCGSIPRARAVSRTIVLASRSPCGPVQALALPLLATIACALPRFRIGRQRRIGAAASVLVVSVPAASAGSRETMRAMSRRPRTLMPAPTPWAA